MTQVGHPQTAQLSGRPEGSAAESAIDEGNSAEGEQPAEGSNPNENPVASTTEPDKK